MGKCHRKTDAFPVPATRCVGAGGPGGSRGSSWLAGVADIRARGRRLRGGHGATSSSLRPVGQQRRHRVHTEEVVRNELPRGLARSPRQTWARRREAHTAGGRKRPSSPPELLLTPARGQLAQGPDRRGHSALCGEEGLLNAGETAKELAGGRCCCSPRPPGRGNRVRGGLSQGWQTAGRALCAENSSACAWKPSNRSSIKIFDNICSAQPGFSQPGVHLGHRPHVHAHRGLSSNNLG